jgi:hypothetical protein
MFGLLVVGIALLWFYLWGTTDINGWRTWGFRLTHQIVWVNEKQLGSRDIYFVTKARENPTRAVKSCIRAFDYTLYYEGLFNHCIAFGSADDAKAQLKNPDLSCEQARATQTPYDTARNADIKVNTGKRCADQRKVLPPGST